MGRTTPAVPLEIVVGQNWMDERVRKLPAP
jgi:hypothetical protein